MRISAILLLCVAFLFVDLPVAAQSVHKCADGGGGHRYQSQPCADGESLRTWTAEVQYPPATTENHEPERPRKLLMHRREIERLIGKTREKGLTLVPTRMYFKGSHAKVEIALAKGKKSWDKRHAIAERTAEREKEQALGRRLKGMD